MSAVFKQKVIFLTYFWTTFIAPVDFTKKKDHEHMKKKQGCDDTLLLQIEH